MQLKKQRLPASTWTELSTRHADRADGLTAGHRSRSARGERHAVEDFLFTYYNTRPSLLRRWHPGAGVALAPTKDGPAPHAAWRWYRTEPDGSVSLDVATFLADRGDTVRFIHRLLTATAARPAFTGCFGLHEWAMAYRQDEHRHPLPLRLGQSGTDAVVEGHQIRCTHFDAFRFFTPSAAPLNRMQPTRESQLHTEQPGCLHAAMDCHKWAMKLGPAVPGEVALDCFELAREMRGLDMQASPYDLSSYGLSSVPIETATGKAAYVTRQRALTDRAADLRQRLIRVCEPLVAQNHG
ncbi:3-methyladenine DNA glycosylase [Modestobacter sp. VKM Ac-2979]|uniref:3-methyladenine DNA glycosylase n=1 Tax=unclassified Modestobacter TaxID=2643866 RepID=UPI0022AB5185|nr:MULTISPECIES: 3-methyladenine DNA glycosylase [unclassified Modestobacter]MCZ2811262.1 3-methyladenine DNA glycosylase [Modestobacter sp. VKM Ac-2979]MCZ2840775.1 3-methyladenine DNA glycosylase [Modestobacter sp. VKM Ac-2980]